MTRSALTVPAPSMVARRARHVLFLVASIPELSRESSQKGGNGNTYIDRVPGAPAGRPLINLVRSVGSAHRPDMELEHAMRARGWRNDQFSSPAAQTRRIVLAGAIMTQIAIGSWTCMLNIGNYSAMLAFCVVMLPAARAVDIVETSEADKTEAKLFKPMLPHGSKPKVGLALGGGGARGAAEVGVLKVLAKEGIKFDYVVGTSIGAVIGGFYCLGASPEQMEEEFQNGKVMREFMTVPLPFRLAVEPLCFVPRLLGSQPYDGLYKGNKFRKYLIGNMAAHDTTIETLKPTFAAVCLNVVDGKPYMIRSGNLGYAMQASCAVPALRKPVEIDGNLFCDGGVSCNLPVKQCRQLGADIVIAVNIDEPFETRPLKHFRIPGSMTDRMVRWALAEIDRPQAQMADVVIHPNTEGISLISTSKRDAQRGIQAGEAAGKAALPSIRKVLSDAGIAIGPDTSTASVNDPK